MFISHSLQWLITHSNYIWKDQHYDFTILKHHDCCILNVLRGLWLHKRTCPRWFSTSLPHRRDPNRSSCRKFYWKSLMSSLSTWWRALEMHVEESRLKPRWVLSLTPLPYPTMRNQNAHKRSWRSSRCISGEMCVSCIQVNSSFGFRVDWLSYSKDVMFNVMM